MFSKLWESPIAIKIAIFVLILSVLVDFTSAALSIGVDAVMVTIAIWAILSASKSQNKQE